MLFDAVRRFVALSEQVGVKGSDPGVKGLMVTLRRSGFSSSQISELSGGKWSSTLVRQYTMGWGGVDENLDNQRKSLMTSLRELASSGVDFTDVENVLILDRSVRARGSSLEELAELVSNLRNLGLQRGEIGKFVALSRELTEQHLTPGMVQLWMTLDQELVEAGFTKTVRLRMREVCEKNGGVVETLKAVIEFNYLDEIQREFRRLEAEVKRLSSEIERLRSVKDELDTEISQRRAMIDAVNNALVLKFDIPSLSLVSVLAKDLGGPYKVTEAIRKYGSLREINEELEAKKAELENVKKETSDKENYLNALNYTLKEAKENYERNSDVRLVVELLVNPRGIKMDRPVVVWLLTRVLDSAIRRIEESPEILSSPNLAWDADYEIIKALADRLRSYNKGT